MKVLGQEQAGCRKHMSFCDHVLYAILSTYLAEKERLFVLLSTMRKRSTELIIPFSGKNLPTMMLKILSAIENIYEKTEACVDANGSLTDVFECRVGVTQGDTLSPLFFII